MHQFNGILPLNHAESLEHGNIVGGCLLGGIVDLLGMSSSTLCSTLCGMSSRILLVLRGGLRTSLSLVPGSCHLVKYARVELVLLAAAGAEM
jgi:hypothetical protein